VTVLLDTHVWLWWILGSNRLPARERVALDRLAARAALRLAAVSLWEAQMLHAKRRLTLDRPFAVWIRDAAAAAVVEIAPLDVEVVVALDGLPASFHGDPADRLIVATARAHRVRLATHDRAIRKSRTVTLWKPR
jgi:PIN domain nuclease of toxin-antitoxin system